MTTHKSPLLFFAFSCLASIGLMSAACSPKPEPEPGPGDEVVCESRDGFKFGFCGKACTCPPDVSNVDLVTPVSFKSEVYPILTSSCSGGSACHSTAAITGLSFGTATTPLDDAGQQALIEQLKMKSNLANIPNVVPQNWQGSFMMMKLDGCQNDMGAVCSVPASISAYIVCADSDANPNNCGDGMPQSEGTANNPTPFPIADVNRDKIRAWIQQGALFN